MNILWLGDSNCQDVLLVGGKAANLSRLVADFCVPPGFCVSSDVHKAASGGGLTHNTMYNTMYNTTTIPATLRDEITAAYTQLARRCRTDEPPVAVRSSGVGEDSSSAAFAGV